ncbi:MAG: hypothetical protein ACRBBP_00790 [Bdellovibrionales bacterium]
MKNLTPIVSTLSIVLCAFQAQALQCSTVFDQKVDSPLIITVEETAALREAKVMEELGYLDRAIEALEKRLVPKELGGKELLITFEENSNLARLYKLDHQYEKAIERELYSLQSKSFKPSDAVFAGLRSSYQRLHETKGDLQNLKNALQVAQAHIRFNPQNYNAHKALLALLKKLDRDITELLPVYDRLHTLAKEKGFTNASWKALKEKIELLISKGRTEDALRDLAIYRSSERTWGHRKTTQIYIWMRMFDKAVESAELEISFTGLKAPAPHLQKITALLGLGRFAEALKTAEAVKENFPAHEQSFNSLILQAQYQHSEF